MKNIRVVSAIICKDNKIFATQRGYGEFKDRWEFPGGKIEENESNENALKREIKEELDIDIKVEKLLDTVEYDYPNFHLTMYCYICKLVDKEPVLLEHESACWVDNKNIKNLNWLPADLEIIDKIIQLQKRG